MYTFRGFNYPLIDWAALFSPCYTYINFVNLALHCNWFQVVNELIRSQNWLDLVFTSAPDAVGQILTLQKFSDHKILQIPLYIPLKNTSFISKKVRDYNKSNYKDMNFDLEQFFYHEFQPHFNQRSVDQN